MKISKQSRRDAKSLFQCCVTDGRLDEQRVRQAVSLLIEKKPRGYVGTLSHLHRLVKLDVERRTARVECATELGADLQSSVRSSLTRSHGEHVNLVFTVNPNLIGGLRVRVGSDVYDGSILARLKNLQASF